MALNGGVDGWNHISLFPFNMLALRFTVVQTFWTLATKWFPLGFKVSSFTIAVFLVGQWKENIADTTHKSILHSGGVGHNMHDYYL